MIRWPDSWYVEEEVCAPSAYWRLRVATLGEYSKLIHWSRGRVAGPPWFRRFAGDTRPPLFKPEEAE